MPIPETIPIDQCGLYAKTSHKKLAEALDINSKDLLLLKDDSLYRIKAIEQQNGKPPRQTQTPIETRRRVHDRIQYLLSKVEMPDYVYSGRKGRSAIANGRAHTGFNYCLEMDIQKYFPSCKLKFVQSFFRFDLMMPKDIAETLAEICTYSGVIPTGSPLSMQIAFWSYKKTFDSIEQLAHQHGIKITLFVDDMTFSTDKPIPRDFEIGVKRLLERVQHSIHPRKTRRSGTGKTRVVTGTAISGQQQLVPNRNQKKIIDILREETSVEKLSPQKIRTVFGMINTARQIEPHFFEGAYKKLRIAFNRLNRDFK
jgi:hypothetical protein